MFKVIVWATDGSRGAEQALPYAKGLVKASGGRLIVVHVNEILPGRGAGPVNLAEGDVQAAIGKLVKDLKQHGLDARLEVADVMAGGAAHAIAEIAKEAGADLIVVGTRGHGPIAELLLGSVSHRLVQTAHCPVMVVPAQRATAAKAAARQQPLASGF